MAKKFKFKVCSWGDDNVLWCLDKSLDFTDTYLNSASEHLRIVHFDVLKFYIKR